MNKEMDKEKIKIEIDKLKNENNQVQFEINQINNKSLGSISIFIVLIIPFIVVFIGNLILSIIYWIILLVIMWIIMKNRKKQIIPNNKILIQNYKKINLLYEKLLK